MVFRVLIVGGTGQVGSAVVRALIAEPACAEVVMINRREVSPVADPRVRQVILDTADATFPEQVSKIAQAMVAHGDVVYGASCIGVGKGSLNWSEEALKALEIGVVGGFARGCRAGGITRFALLSAAGSSTTSRIRYARIMGQKEEAVREIGFQRLAIFRPGIIAGNVHTPGYVAWLGRLIPGSFGTIEQDDIGRAFVAEFAEGSALTGTVYLENGAMRKASFSRRDRHA
ncbi:NAD-dependent epimerase/dehydratase family protein [Bradyrhizobium jicamae]|uniref:NAD-dependent epimerase/dehydratase family protein n=1 Tax=Bradyrhizobium jicamae TaxID=280332 RepID=UPI001BA4A1BE|nr:NAD-dependent epimerase/dehydratase family protein [Bradyrhizobium jicamae]MBR0937531.1 NAD(P)H-binding protein [Bradyrhizobium jicamae]